MKFQCLKAILPMLAASAMFTACDPSSEDDTVESNLAQCLTYGENVSTHAQNFNKMSFIAQFDNKGVAADISIIGMVLPDAGNPNGIAIPRMELHGLPWQYNAQGWRTITAEDVTPVITGMSVVPQFKKVNFYLADVFDNNGNYRPGIQYRLVVKYESNEYELVGCCMSGTTAVTTPGGGSYSPESDAAVKNKPVYWVDFNYTDKTADIYMYNAKFLSNMPPLNLLFPAVPYTIDNGKIMLKCDALTPLFGGLPFPSFPITALTGQIDYSSSTMDLKFNCNFRGEDYLVKVDCKY